MNTGGDKPLQEMKISDVISNWPQTADVFHRNNMACVGCAVAPFYTIADAAIIYGLSPQEFTDQLAQIIKSDADETPQSS